MQKSMQGKKVHKNGIKETIALAQHNKGFESLKYIVVLRLLLQAIPQESHNRTNHVDNKVLDAFNER